MFNKANANMLGDPLLREGKVVGDTGIPMFKLWCEA